MGLFEPQVSRKPDLYPWANEYIDALWSGFWTPHEFDFISDVGQFNNDLSKQEQQIIIRTLAAIAQIEINVKKFWSRLGDNLDHPSIHDLGDVMAHSEVIHNKAYEKLIEKLGLDDIFKTILKEDVILNRIQYLRKYNEKVYEDKQKQYIYSIILFTLFTENVSLFSQFYVILWFNRVKNVLKDTAQQVQYTKNEEGLHAQIGVKIIKTLEEEYPQYFDDEMRSRIIEATHVAYRSEAAIAQWILGEFDETGDKDGEGLSSEVLQSFIKSRFNDSLEQIGIPKQFEVAEEDADKIQWMREEILGAFKTDFFHKKPIEYQRHMQTFDADDMWD